MCFGSEEGAGGAAARGVGRVGGGGAVLHGLPHAVADELLDVVGARAGGDVGHVVRLGMEWQDWCMLSFNTHSKV